MMYCSIGEQLSENCNKVTLTRKVGVVETGELDNSDVDLLKWKGGVCQELNVCLHHETKYLDRYVNLQKYCSDPFNAQKVKVKVHLRVITKKLVRKINKKPGGKLCRHCYAEAVAENMEESTDNKDEPYQPPPTNETLNKSPLKSVSQRDCATYRKRKFQESTAATQDLFKSLNLRTSSFDSQPRETSCKESKDLRELMAVLKKTIISSSSKNEQISLLTMSPSSWTIKGTADFFGVTYYMVRQSRTLYKEKGILVKRKEKEGKFIPADVIKQVQDFY